MCPMQIDFIKVAMECYHFYKYPPDGVVRLKLLLEIFEHFFNI